MVLFYWKCCFNLIVLVCLFYLELFENFYIVCVFIVEKIEILLFDWVDGIELIWYMWMFLMGKFFKILLIYYVNGYRCFYDL